jgi:hypothetical protein
VLHQWERLQSHAGFALLEPELSLRRMVLGDREMLSVLAKGRVSGNPWRPEF